ncbi:hypothetical protein CAPTEDRAFT_187456 [Capitella teleta]|uniref:Uncharacterized protein n=1 Tax=Capitella teleta TaxID=283909 RepID=R7VFH3_CAPTE|nr:hypothetical protein CAPTEDRAFT_187456 [Capitella teleta]|eukprot:ELU17317.1 hypothetical protein CAPTEDRAFT_187456 [Capitella teleta]
MKIVGGVQGGIRSLTRRVEMCHRVAGLVKFAAKRSGSRFLIGREGWKSGVVSRIMYGGGALVWKVEERSRLEKEQTAFGRWLWKAHPSVRNACIQAESGWSTFSEREAKAKVGYVRKIYVGGSMVAEIMFTKASFVFKQQYLQIRDRRTNKDCRVMKKANRRELKETVEDPARNKAASDDAGGNATA